MRRRVPFETRFGRGWVCHSEGVVDDLVLPGLPAPEGTDDRDPPPGVEALVAELSEYFAGHGDLVPRLAWADRADTPFLKSVYRVVAAIPPGRPLTYGEVAAAAGHPGAARAVGSAMARNRLAPVIPCHRVVPAAGGVGSYGGGSRMKQALLEMEGHGR